MKDSITGTLRCFKVSLVKSIIGLVKNEWESDDWNSYKTEWHSYCDKIKH